MLLNPGIKMLAGILHTTAQCHMCAMEIWYNGKIC